MKRFHASVKATEFYEKNWRFDLFERTYLALETHALKGKKLEERIALKIGLSETGDESGGQVGVRVQLEDRGLKAAAHNCVVISVMILQSEINRKVINSVMAGAGVVMQWHSVQNELLRSCKATGPYMAQQIESGYLQHIAAVLATVFNAPALQTAGFWLGAFREGPGLLDDLGLVLEDDSMP